MALATIRGLDKLKENLENAREKLKTTDEDLRKIIGRDPTGNSFENKFGRRPPVSSPPIPIDGARRLFTAGFKRALSGNLNDAPQAKRGPLTTPVVYSRIEAPGSGGRGRRQLESRVARWQEEEEEEPKEDQRVVLTSSVVRVTESRSRQQAINDMKKLETDNEKQRGRRMLGVMLGTLTQFKAEAEASTKSTLVKRRQLVDERVEERDRKEQQRLKNEKSDLFREKQSCYREIRLIQQKMRAAEAFERWEKENSKMKGFIRTEKKPYIFYRPKVESEESKKRIELTSQAINSMIEEKRQAIEKELADVLTLGENASAGGGVDDQPEVVAGDRRRSLHMDSLESESEEEEARVTEVSLEKTIEEELKTEDVQDSPKGSMASVEEPVSEIVDCVATKTVTVEEPEDSTPSQLDKVD